jgi:hypothetical protein
MINTESKKAQAENMIQEFTVAFYNKFKVTPIVSYAADVSILSRVHLSEIERIANQELAKWYEPMSNTDVIPTVRTRKRQRTIVTYRHLYFYFSRQLGYSLNTIGERIGYDHASVLHGSTTIQNLIDNRDKLVIYKYTEMQKFLLEDAKPNNEVSV